MGTAGNAVAHSKKTHRLELPPNIEGEKNYTTILNKIMEFVGAKKFSSQFIPPFYIYSGFSVDGDDFDGPEVTLNKIAAENGLDNAFRAFRAEQLLFQLHKHVIKNRNHHSAINNKPFASIVTATEVEKNNFLIFIT